jgi:DNA-binding NarL/FixJ family response regulator
MSPVDHKLPAVTRVLIAVRVRLYREGLADGLGRRPEFEVVATTGDAAELVQAVGALHPDVVLLDHDLPMGTQLIRQLTDADDPVPVVALAPAASEEELLECAEAGISGFLSYDEPLDHLLETLHSVGRGEAVCPAEMARVLLMHVSSLARQRSHGWYDSGLTAREFQIVELINEGLSNKQIARRLCIQLSTVKNHVHHVLEKLKVTRRGEAVALLRHSGILN